MSASSRRLSFIFATFLLVSFLTGIAGALQAPTLSLFLSHEVKVRPLWVGLFYTVNALAGIAISFLLANYSDKKGDRRILLFFCSLMAIGNSLVFAFSRDYLVLISVGVLLAAIGNASMPQLFALAREYADRSAREVVMFSSMMRATLSLAWVLGPPVSFMLALNYGFTLMYLCAAAVFVFSAAMVWFFLPSVARIEQPVDTVVVHTSAWKNRDVRLLFFASLLMWTCNIMYIIDMPLYITTDMGLPEGLAGLLMGAAAGLEIPVMLIAGYLVKRTGKRKLMICAAGFGVLFYLGMVFFQFKAALMILQLFNAIFIGIIAGIGMLYFQDLMPGRAGSATTLFTNSISTGAILAGVLQGSIVENFGHFPVYCAALGLAVIALILMTRVKNV
ncbi:MFS transporter [Rouxiella chamberiensis]|uniref:MFS transporter n=1 Tax=Rouxiella chamberiensis TaxID=1513468 RepID=A0ABY7HLB7_9GAMM|nr:MFS transporter [Rouxiella chamberiensis]WAT00183.1 MFS transporter [Rouxiella chamberiensis]